MNMPKNMKSIGNGQFEAACHKCGEIFIHEKADDTFVEYDAAGDVWVLCSRCYTGPRANPDVVAAKRAEILGNNQNDG